MLGKSKSEEMNPESTSTSMSSETKTLIGQNISIEGDIRGEGDLVIEGSVKGSVQLEKYHLIVGPKGHVEAEIHAGNVTVSGWLNGNINALDKVAITQDADFNGEIKAKRISIEDGAYLKAVIELERESQIKAVPTDKLAVQKTFGTDKDQIPLANDTDKGK
jgi:cytoskeletal protein CcmA (bactofilin family)